MEVDQETLGKRCELLQRQTHHLTSQIFHMIHLQMGYIRRIAELERVVDDKMFLAEHLPSEEGMDIPMDLSPSIRRKLIQLEQVKAILHRRNDLVVELERQLNLLKENQERQLEGIKALKDHLHEKDIHIEKLNEHAKMLTAVVDRWWNNPLYKVLVRVKRILTGGRRK